MKADDLGRGQQPVEGQAAESKLRSRPMRRCPYVRVDNVGSDIRQKPGHLLLPGRSSCWAVPATLVERVRALDEFSAVEVRDASAELDF